MDQANMEEDMCYPHATVLVPMLVGLRPKPGKVHILNWDVDAAAKHGAWLYVVDAINLITPK